MIKKPSGLGRGLGALLGESAFLSDDEPQNGNGGMTMLPITDVENYSGQPRKNFDPEALAQLADSIRQHGILQPLTVRKLDSGYYQIIAGERRWRAAKLAGLREIPVIVKEYTDEEIDEISLIENIQREDLNPVEEAAAYERLLKEYGLTQEELSERVSKSRTAITNSLRLLRLPEAVQEMLRDGKISTGHAKVLLSLDSPEKQEAAARTVVDEGLSVRDTEKLVKNFDKAAPAPKKPKDLKSQLAYQEAEDQLKALLKSQVRIRRKKENTGRIEIEYYSLEELERIMSHIR